MLVLMLAMVTICPFCRVTMAIMARVTVLRIGR